MSASHNCILSFYSIILIRGIRKKIKKHQKISIEKINEFNNYFNPNCLINTKYAMSNKVYSAFIQYKLLRAFRHSDESSKFIR